MRVSGPIFHVLRARTQIRPYRGRWVLFSCFTRTDSFFGGTEGVRCCFLVLRYRTHFRRYRGRRVQFSCFARPDSFSTVPKATGSVLRAQTHFRRYRGSRVLFSYSALPDTFLAVRSVPSPIFMFCEPRLIFSGSDGVQSHFHVFPIPDMFINKMV
jgi:hypothetical protein